MAENKGWIKLDRCITEHWIFSDAEKFRAWVDLLIMANHDSKKVLLREGVLVVKRGQFVTSIETLAVRWKWSKSRVVRFLALLEAEQMVKRDCNQFRTLLTIENYGKFQGQRNTNEYTNEYANKHTGESTNEYTNESTSEYTGESRTRKKEYIKNKKESKEYIPSAHLDPEDDYVSDEEWKKRLAEQDDDW